MRFKLKELKENTLEDFLLNPFSQSAMFNDDIIQKYKINDRVDAIFLLSEKRGDCRQVGIACYNYQEIFLWIRNVFGESLCETKPFRTRSDANYRAIDIITKRLAKFNENYLEKIKETEEYKRAYWHAKERYFEAIIFHELGAASVQFSGRAIAEFELSSFLDELHIVDLTLILAGETKSVDQFIKRISTSKEFIEEQIIRPELIKEAKAYIEKGIFTKREQFLIDYLSKTKIQGVRKVTIKTTTGNLLNCHNQVNCYGKIFSTDGLSGFIDVEYVDAVIHEGEVLFKK